VDVGDKSKVTLHLVRGNSFEIHHPADHGVFFILESAIEQLTHLCASGFLPSRIPGLYKRILQGEVFWAYEQFLLDRSANGINFGNLKFLSLVNPVEHARAKN
jgi:hypothetical protein